MDRGSDNYPSLHDWELVKHGSNGKEAERALIEFLKREYTGSPILPLTLPENSLTIRGKIYGSGNYENGDDIETSPVVGIRSYCGHECVLNVENPFGSMNRRYVITTRSGSMYRIERAGARLGPLNEHETRLAYSIHPRIEQWRLVSVNHSPCYPYYKGCASKKHYPAEDAFLRYMHYYGVKYNSEWKLPQGSRLEGYCSNSPKCPDETWIITSELVSLKRTKMKSEDGEDVFLVTTRSGSKYAIRMHDYNIDWYMDCRMRSDERFVM